jgi:pimeloyl-ACP methyl ester carboxylesterase
VGISEYSFDNFAAAVAGIVEPGARAVVLGHSLGGVVGLALGSGRFAVSVRAVIGLGIKVVWTGEDLDRAQAAARRSPAWFASRDDAAARYLRLSGLAGLLPVDDRAWATTHTSRARNCRSPSLPTSMIPAQSGRHISWSLLDPGILQP